MNKRTERKQRREEATIREKELLRREKQNGSKTGFKLASAALAGVMALSVFAYRSHESVAANAHEITPNGQYDRLKRHFIPNIGWSGYSVASDEAAVPLEKMPRHVSCSWNIPDVNSGDIAEWAGFGGTALNWMLVGNKPLVQTGTTASNQLFKDGKTEVTDLTAWYEHISPENMMSTPVAIPNFKLKIGDEMQADIWRTVNSNFHFKLQDLSQNEAYENDIEVPYPSGLTGECIAEKPRLIVNNDAIINNGPFKFGNILFNHAEVDGKPFRDWNVMVKFDDNNTGVTEPSTNGAFSVYYTGPELEKTITQKMEMSVNDSPTSIKGYQIRLLSTKMENGKPSAQFVILKNNFGLGIISASTDKAVKVMAMPSKADMLAHPSNAVAYANELPSNIWVDLSDIKAREGKVTARFGLIEPIPMRK